MTAHSWWSVRVHLCISGIDAASVTVPDLEGSVFDRRAAPPIDDSETESQRQTGFALRDVSPQNSAIQIIRALSEFRVEHAGRGFGMICRGRASPRRKK